MQALDRFLKKILADDGQFTLECDVIDYVIDESGSGVGKSLVTMLSVDDGASWTKLKAPLLDSGRRKYDCGDSCDLHLHAFTERIDDRDMFSFNGAPGLVIGVGNVGSRLAEYASVIRS